MTEKSQQSEQHNSDMLVASRISKSFQLGDATITVLDDVSVTVKSGEFVAIMGRSGSGKSTLLSILAGLDNPDSGTVRLGEHEISGMNEDQLARVRQTEIGFVFQSFHLIPTLTVAENIRFPLQIARIGEQREHVDTLIRQVDLAHRSGSFPHQLSGGEKQRTAIARALVTQPGVLFADEPTGNLDASNAAQVMETLIALQRQYQTTLIVVTHDPEIAAMADRIINLDDGHVAAAVDTKPSEHSESQAS